MRDSDRSAPDESRLVCAAARHVRTLRVQTSHCRTPAHRKEGCQ